MLKRAEKGKCKGEFTCFHEVLILLSNIAYFIWNETFLPLFL